MPGTMVGYMPGTMVGTVHPEDHGGGTVHPEDHGVLYTLRTMVVYPYPRHHGGIPVP